MTTAELVKATDFRSLESEHRTEVCIAHLNPAGKAGEDRISVEFEVNQQRILTATVFDLVTGEKLADKEAIAKLKWILNNFLDRLGTDLAEYKLALSISAEVSR